MKILCDVHIPYKLVRLPRERDIEALHVNDILDRWHTTDSAISRFADKHDFFVFTKDVDFRNSYFIHGSPRKVIRILLGNIPNDVLIFTVESHLDIIRSCFDHKRCYLEIHRDGIALIDASDVL